MMQQYQINYQQNYVNTDDHYKSKTIITSNTYITSLQAIPTLLPSILALSFNPTLQAIHTLQASLLQAIPLLQAIHTNITTNTYNHYNQYEHYYNQYIQPLQPIRTLLQPIHTT
eukprot:801903_1